METLTYQTVKLLLEMPVALVALVTAFAGFVALPNDAQKRITQKDSSGWGIIAAGVAAVALSLLYANGILPHMIGTYDMGGFLMMLFAYPGWLLIAVGGIIALPDDFTDKWLDQKHLWKISILVALILAAALTFLK